MEKKYTFGNPPLTMGQIMSLRELFPPEHNMSSNRALQAAIEGTPNLSRASLQNALLFGGPLVKWVLERAPLVGDRPFTIVDTKVTLLLPGFIPAIPGWHTDGVPRGMYHNPYDTGIPSLSMQRVQHDNGTFPRFHTVILGNPCLTEFVDVPTTLSLRHSEDPDLYKEVSTLINQGDYPTVFQPHEKWVSWSWWNIHRAVPATERGWRLQMRVAEMYHAPLESGFIRAQSQVYVPEEFGW
jgi:hypothetical protein